METGRQIIEAERRKEKAKDLKIRVNRGDKSFRVIGADGSVKYLGFAGKSCFCGCKSYEFGQTADFFAEHGTYFECKHIMAAKSALADASGQFEKTEPVERVRVF